jgi:hypothetical protein
MWHKLVKCCQPFLRHILLVEIIMSLLIILSYTCMYNLTGFKLVLDKY